MGHLGHFVTVFSYIHINPGVFENENLSTFRSRSVTDANVIRTRLKCLPWMEKAEKKNFSAEFPIKLSTF